MFLGNFSTEALGAAMTVMGVFWTPMALLQQTASYVTTFVAQYLGSGQKQTIGKSLWQGIYFCFIGGNAFLLLNLFSDDFFKMVGHEPALQNLEVLYFNSIAYSALPTALVAAFSGFFTGLGQTRMVMLINAVGLLLNALLDYLLIFGNGGFPAMGVEGAGYATSIAGYGSAIFAAAVVFNRNKEATFGVLSGWRWNTDIMKRFIKYGLPSGMQWALEGMAFTVFLIVIGNFPNGVASLSGSSIAVTLMMLAVLPSMGVAQSVMALVGQHIGEKKPDLATRDTFIGIQMTAAYIFAVGLTLVFLPEIYLYWFKNDQNPVLWTEVSAITKNLLIFIAVFTLFDSTNFNISFALKGAGDTTFVSLVSLIMPWPCFVLPTFLLESTDHAVYYGWGFVTLYAVILSAIYFLRFRQGKWKEMSVID